jgi:hypothetical protein
MRVIGRGLGQVGAGEVGAWEGVGALSWARAGLQDVWVVSCKVVLIPQLLPFRDYARFVHFHHNTKHVCGLKSFFTEQADFIGETLHSW